MKKLLFSFLIILALSACGTAPAVVEEAAGAAVSTVSCECGFYEPERLHKLAKDAEKDEALSGIRTAVVPHYSPRLDMLCRVLASIDYEPDTFVIVAPDHPAKGSITLSCSDWYWENSEMLCDGELIGELSHECELNVSSELDDSEWSAAALLPYINYLFPDAKVAIIYVSRSAAAVKLAQIADFLAELDSDRIFLLCSADFSHYQDVPTASENDRYTRKVIEGMDAGSLLRLGNEYLDSPQSVAVGIYYAAALGMSFTQYDSVLEPYYDNGTLLAGSYHLYAAK